MSIKLDVQKLIPGSRVRLIEVDCTEFGGDLLRFHNYDIPYTQAELEAAQASGADLAPKKIVWQGQDYFCWPYQINGIEMDGTGSATSPTLSVANLNSEISAMCLEFQDLAQAKVIIHTTFQHYLDGEPEADPDQEFVQVWYIDYKQAENNLQVTWNLANPAAVGGKLIPARQVQPICYWMLMGGYRGPDCGYTGTNYFDVNGNPVSDPNLDVCSGMVSTGCKPRFGADQPLSYGGFISSGDLN